MSARARTESKEREKEKKKEKTYLDVDLGLPLGGESPRQPRRRGVLLGPVHDLSGPLRGGADA